MSSRPYQTLSERIGADAVSAFGTVPTQVAKRSFDLAIAGFGLIVLAPAFALIALGIKLDSQGPVFYRGARIGRHGRPFNILKFRTMLARTSNIGPGITIASDNRLTRLGHLLRWAKLDELPQLLNV